MDRQDPGATSLEDEPGEKIEDTQGYLTEMKRKLFGSGDLDVNGMSMAHLDRGLRELSRPVLCNVFQQLKNSTLEGSNGE